MDGSQRTAQSVDAGGRVSVALSLRKARFGLLGVCVLTLLGFLDCLGILEAWDPWDPLELFDMLDLLGLCDSPEESPDLLLGLW